jgi:hypothetical protein
MRTQLLKLAEKLSTQWSKASSQCFKVGGPKRLNRVDVDEWPEHEKVALRDDRERDE